MKSKLESLFSIFASEKWKKKLKKWKSKVPVHSRKDWGPKNHLKCHGHHPSYISVKANRRGVTFKYLSLTLLLVFERGTWTLVCESFQTSPKLGGEEVGQRFITFYFSFFPCIVLKIEIISFWWGLELSVRGKSQSLEEIEIQLPESAIPLSLLKIHGLMRWITGYHTNSRVHTTTQVNTMTLVNYNTG